MAPAFQELRIVSESLTKDKGLSGTENNFTTPKADKGLYLSYRSKRKGNQLGK